MLYVVYFGSGDNWTLLETSFPIDFYTTLEHFKRKNNKSVLVSDFINYINETYGEGMARRATYKTVSMA